MLLSAYHKRRSTKEELEEISTPLVHSQSSMSNSDFFIKELRIHRCHFSQKLLNRCDKFKQLQVPTPLSWIKDTNNIY